MMGILLFYPILLACLLIPPALIYRSPLISGWKKAAWVSGCFISAFVPLVLVKLGVAVAVEFGNYERSMQTVLFGMESRFKAAANILGWVFPWVIYFAFKLKQNQS